MNSKKIAKPEKKSTRGNWQLRRLHIFIDYEEEAARDLEFLCELNGTKLTFKELSVLVFIQRKEYLRKPGSLVCLYRVWKSKKCEGVTQNERYALYYEALQEWGYL